MLSLTAAAAQAGEVGKVRFVKEAKADFDPYTKSPTPSQAAWMRDHFWRQKTYAPYFDTRTSWYENAWTYKDLYAIYVDGRGEVKPDQHPEWILKDAQGNRLYIPYNCHDGACSQFAGDPGNPAFRAQWIAVAKQTLAHGYRGLFVDDVNMELRVSNGEGKEVAPIDPRTGTTMTLADWRRYIAEFVEEITAAVKQQDPTLEVAHNAIWFSGHTDPFVQRELLAADTLDLERGINDDKQPGSGQFSFSTFLSHIDWLHQRGKGVVMDSYTDTQDGAEYNLAAYFLIATEKDGFRTDYRSVPDNWWSAYDVDLGDPKGPRYTTADGLVRRDFAGGYALANPPGSTARTIALGAGARAADGTPRESVSLPPSSGRVVLTSGANPQQPPVLSASAVPPASEDKAEGRPAIASSSESGRSPGLAVDGNSGSRWASEFGEGEWWQVDLGSDRAVSSVEIGWEDAYAARFRVLTSSDGAHFSVAADASATSAGRQTVSFSARQARYVRIQSVQRATQYGISFWEVEVHGPEDGGPAPGTTDPSPAGSDPAPGDSGPAAGSSDHAPGDADPVPDAPQDIATGAHAAALVPTSAGGTRKLVGNQPPLAVAPGHDARKSVLRLSLRLRSLGRGAQAGRARVALEASGRTLASVGGGTVRLRLERLVRGRWTTIRTAATHVRQGAFRRVFAGLSAGRYRVVATHVATHVPPAGGTPTAPVRKRIALG